MDDVIYIPAVIKMATTKIEFCRGKRGKELRRLIALAEVADRRAMALRPDTSDPVFCAALDAATVAGRALYEFAKEV